MEKHKVTAYLPNDLYTKLRKYVFSQMKEKNQIRGLMSTIVVEAIKKYLEEVEVD